MSITQAFLDVREWEKFLKKTDKRIEASHEVLKAGYITIGFRNIIKHFRDEKGPDGRWKKRSRATQRSYASRGKKDKKFNPSNRLLQLSGDMRNAILPSSTKKVGKHAILIFNSKLYSGVHDRGSSKKGIPERKFMWFDNRTLELMGRFFLSKLI